VSIYHFDRISLIAAPLSCEEIQNQISLITEGEYIVAKQRVDELRQQLGQPPIPTLQSIIDERTAAYLTERRLKGPSSLTFTVTGSERGSPLERPASEPTLTSATNQRDPESGEPPAKRPRGRPKGSKNKPKGFVN